MRGCGGERKGHCAPADVPTPAAALRGSPRCRRRARLGSEREWRLPAERCRPALLPLCRPAAANDGTNRLKVEDLRDFIYHMPEEDD